VPKVSLASASTVKDSGIAEDRSETFDGFTINFVTVLQSHDLAAMLKALPGGNCSCPHWGYVFSPAEELAALEAAMARSMQEPHGD